ncbi:MAG: GDP-mannose 4,6-dehydratase, partial [Bacteroidales bacterium]|nr:GDP-mannose 4,6-dehydratase [Bacteroidales bacterium]
MKHILITGGAGFIGSHLVRHWVNKYSDTVVVNLDKLTYAGNLENLRDIENRPNYIFEKGDITDVIFVNALFEKYRFDGIIHLAAESHVDRSITNPLEFIITNIVGTATLLNAARAAGISRFYHVSTDEVY